MVVPNHVDDGGFAFRRHVGLAQEFTYQARKLAGEGFVWTSEDGYEEVVGTLEILAVEVEMVDSSGHDKRGGRASQQGNRW
jgi:hypothetical protein